MPGRGPTNTIPQGVPEEPHVLPESKPVKTVPEVYAPPRNWFDPQTIQTVLSAIVILALGIGIWLAGNSVSYLGGTQISNVKKNITPIVTVSVSPTPSEGSRVTANQGVGSTNSENATPTAIQATNTPTVTTTSVSPTATPTPAYRTVNVSGFAYEDRNNDGVFNSDDPKLPNMQLDAFDTYNPSKQISTYYTDNEGNFNASLNVRGDLNLKPTAYNNFTPKSSQQSYSSDTSGVRFGFRSTSAPTGSNYGVIEGDIYHDANQNQSRDSGESGTYFYKLYLTDSQGNHYLNGLIGGQATNDGGHFKYENLPVGSTYTLELSTEPDLYTTFETEYTFSLTKNQSSVSNVQIPVVRQ